MEDPLQSSLRITDVLKTRLIFRCQFLPLRLHLHPFGASQYYFFPLSLVYSVNSFIYSAFSSVIPSELVFFLTRSLNLLSSENAQLASLAFLSNGDLILLGCQPSLYRVSGFFKLSQIVFISLVNVTMFHLVSFL